MISCESEYLRQYLEVNCISARAEFLTPRKRLDDLEVYFGQVFNPLLVGQLLREHDKAFLLVDNLYQSELDRDLILEKTLPISEILYFLCSKGVEMYEFEEWWKFLLCYALRAASPSQKTVIMEGIYDLVYRKNWNVDRVMFDQFLCCLIRHLWLGRNEIFFLVNSLEVLLKDEKKTYLNFPQIKQFNKHRYVRLFNTSTCYFLERFTGQQRIDQLDCAMQINDENTSYQSFLRKILVSRKSLEFKKSKLNMLALRSLKLLCGSNREKMYQYFNLFNFVVSVKSFLTNKKLLVLMRDNLHWNEHFQKDENFIFQLIHLNMRYCGHELFDIMRQLSKFIGLPLNLLTNQSFLYQKSCFYYTPTTFKYI